MGMYDVEKDSYPGFSDELDVRAKKALYSTWDRIAGDYLVDEKGRPDEGMTITKEELLEVVLDADRMAGSDAEAARYTIWLSRFHTDHFNSVTNSAFSYDTYGY